jgi:hypothetical protein
MSEQLDIDDVAATSELAKQELIKLKESFIHYKSNSEAWEKVADGLSKELAALRADNQRMREALRWYAKNVGNCNSTKTVGNIARKKLAKDFGSIAISALGEEERKIKSEIILDFFIFAYVSMPELHRDITLILNKRGYVRWFWRFYKRAW